MYRATDPWILTTPAFKLIEEGFKDFIPGYHGPTYICNICWKSEFRKNAIKLMEPKYQSDIYNECNTGKSDWICKNCHNSVSKYKMSIQCHKMSQLNEIWNFFLNSVIWIGFVHSR